jgi:hypothetical protein
MANQTMSAKWYHERRWAAVISPVALIGCYIMASLAIDSGSLLQYFVAVILLVLGINRLAHIVLVSLGKRAA